MRKSSYLKCGAILLALSMWVVAAHGQVKNPKRGIAYGYHRVEDLQAISGSLSWWYNWSVSPETAVAGVYADYGMDFVPMAWNNLFNESKLREFYTNHPEARYLLGFNEPNFREQANMTPSAAAAAWPALEAIADEFGLELVGPAVNWCGNCVSEGGVTFTDPYRYLDSFFVACSGCRVDYIAVHNYMCYAEPVIGYLEGFRKYGKKIWLTEFACWDQSTITLQMQKNLVIGALDYLDNDTMIYRYSWFTGRSDAGTPYIDLYGDEPGTLTELGEFYVNYHPVHDTGLYLPVPGRIEAESYSTMSGISLEATSDFDGLVNVGWIDAGDWLEYNILPPASGDYYLYLRIASTAASTLEVRVEDTLAAVIQVPLTGGWQRWRTVEGVVTLKEGKTRLRLYAPVGSFNINWLAILEGENHLPSCSAGEDLEVIYPESTSAMLAGEGSDSDGDSLRYLWTRTSGGACEIGSPESPSTIISGLKPGIYYFRLTVSDGFETVTDDVRIRVVDGTVGAGAALTGGLEVYPNPVSGMLTVRLPERSGECSIEVLNPLGQAVLFRKLTGGETEFAVDMGTLRPGIYLVRLRTDQVTYLTTIFR